MSTKKKLNEKLMLASEKGDLDTVKQLIENPDVDVNYVADDKQTALHRAASKGHLSVLKILIEKKANVNAKRMFGWSVLQVASEHGNSNCVKLLIQAGAVIDDLDDEGRTALHWACQNYHTETVRLLLESGAKVNIQDGDGNTPIHIGAKHLQVKIVELLIAFSADVKPRNKKGYTPKYRLLKEDRSVTYTEEKAKNIIDMLDNPSKVPRMEVGSSIHEQEIQQHKDIMYDINNNIVSGEELSTLFDELQDKIVKLSGELDKSQHKLKGTMEFVKQLMNMVKTLKSKLDAHNSETRKIRDQIEAFYGESSRSGSIADDDFNEYVYFRIFNLVSQNVGGIMHKWKELARLLFVGYPKQFVKKMVANINSHHSGDVERTYELLTLWKMYNASYTDKIQVLKRAVGEMKLDNTKLVLEEIDYHIKKHGSEKTDEDYADCLKDKGLDELAAKVGTKWNELAENLGIKERHVPELKKTSGTNQALSKDMLIKWRNSERGFVDIKVARLTEALKRTGLENLSESLIYNI